VRKGVVAAPTRRTILVRRLTFVAAVAMMLIVAVAVVIGSSRSPRSPTAAHTQHRPAAKRTATSSSAKHSPVSGPVPCPLTHEAGADPASSCWATHTGVRGSTGYTEAQIKHGAPGFTHVIGNVVVDQPGTVIDHQWISGCVAIYSSADNVTIRNSLITPHGNNCQGDAGTPAIPRAARSTTDRDLPLRPGS
jgi:hypothetical protein